MTLSGARTSTSAISTNGHGGAGWDETETFYAGSLQKSAGSLAFGRRYRYAPVSALYVFGRGQDVALQKARVTISVSLRLCCSSRGGIIR